MPSVSLFPCHPFLTIISGQRYHIATETTPLPATPDILQEYWDFWYNVTNDNLEVPGVIASLAYQPMPMNITSKAIARGGVSRRRGLWTSD